MVDWTINYDKFGILLCPFPASKLERCCVTYTSQADSMHKRTYENGHVWEFTYRQGISRESKLVNGMSAITPFWPHRQKWVQVSL